MASLLKFGFIIKRSVHTAKPLCIGSSTQRWAYWNKDWMPGPYPKTAAARAAAAKKYGLRPQDYEPYPDEEGYGDYPKLPEIGDDSKDFYNNYDMPDLRRNYGEPMHKDADIYTIDRYDPTGKYPMSLNKIAVAFIAFLASMFALYQFFERFKVYPAVMPKQYVKDGVKHYTFETTE